MTVQRTQPLLFLITLLLALVALGPAPASAADSLASSGNILDNQITSLDYDPASSNATIGGVIRCSTPTELTVFGMVSQYRAGGNRHAQYYGGVELLCDTTPTSYTVTVTQGYESDRLVPGPATVGFWAEYCDSTGCAGHPTYKEMRLRP